MVPFRAPRRRTLWSPWLEMPRRGGSNGRTPRFFFVFVFFCWGRGEAVHGVPSLEVRRLVKLNVFICLSNYRQRHG